VGSAKPTIQRVLRGGRLGGAKVYDFLRSRSMQLVNPHKRRHPETFNNLDNVRVGETGHCDLCEMIEILQTQELEESLPR
jgi:hypothetical protein